VEKKDLGTEKDGNPWVILVVICLGLLSFATSFQSVPPILPLLVEEFGFTHAQAGSLMSFFCLAGIFISIPAAMLAERKEEEPRIFYTIKAGHKIWVEIASKDFWYREHLRTVNISQILPLPPTNAVHYDSKYPSHLLLPVIPDASIVKPVEPPLYLVKWSLLLNRKKRFGH
jgi:hypothetical protein